MTPENETAAAVFERINRRRAPVAETRAFEAGPGRTGNPERAMGSPRRASIDEVSLGEPIADPVTGPLNDPVTGPLRDPIADPLDDPIADPLADPIADRHAESLAGPGADRFPRSATMRLILKHPALALGLGLPAAGLLLKSPASRRLLGMAVRVGTGPELQTLIRLSEPRRENPLP